MFEWLTVVSGFTLGIGAAFFGRTFGRALTVVAIAAVALVATVSSGEASRSWAYFGIDVFQATVAFGCGFVAVAWLRRRPSHR